MNSKMIAVLAVAIMAVSGCVVTMSAQSDAEAVDLGMVYVDENSAEAQIKFNETAYSIYESYDFLIAAQVAGYDPEDVYAKNGDAEVTQKSADLVVNTGEQELNLSIDGSEGVYTVTIGNDKTTPVSSGTYKIVFTLYVTAYPEVNAGLEMTPIQYELDVNVRSFISSTFTSVSGTMIAGASGFFEVSATLEGDKNVTDFNSWYATDLPDGLNVGIIEDKLTIYGMTATSEDNIKCNVDLIGRDAVGNEVRITDVKFTINKTPKITYEITNVKKVAGVADAYMVESGKTPAPTLTIKVDGTDYNSASNGRQLIVSVISEDGERTDNPYTSGMTIPTNGVGKYVIEMTIGGFSTDGNEVNGVSTNAILYVVPNITGAGAGFIVVGQP